MSEHNQRVTFGAFNKDISELSYRWLNDAEIAVLTDAPKVTREIQQQFFASLPTRHDYHIWAIFFDSKPIGCLGIKNVQDGSGEYWGYIGEKEYWGRGVGRTMLVKAMVEAKKLNLTELTLEVIKSNSRARNLYLKFGFTEVGASKTKIFMRKKVVRFPEELNGQLA